MRPLILFALLLLAGCAAPGANQATDANALNGYEFTVEDGSKRILSMVSPVHSVNLSRAEILSRGQLCVSRHLSNNAVMLSGGTQPFFGGAGINSADGGAVLQRVDEASGLLTAVHRVDYNRAYLGFSAEATLIIEAKDGRFRITQSGLRSAQKTTGYVKNTGYDPILKAWGLGWEAALVALQGPSGKLAECISAPPDAW